MPFVNFLDEVQYKNKVTENKSILEYKYENCLVLESIFKRILSISVSLRAVFIILQHTQRKFLNRISL
jgi:hypothetical protein